MLKNTRKQVLDKVEQELRLSKETRIATDRRCSEYDQRINNLMGEI